MKKRGTLDENDSPYQGVEPEGDPIWLTDPERAATMLPQEYASAPNFDQELELRDEDPTPFRGKGPSRGYEERWRAIARYHALGFTSKRIGEILGYSPTGISLALKQPWVQNEVEKFRSQYYDTDILAALKAAGPDAIRLIHRTILDEDAKADLRSTNARWLAEKLTGKAKQEVSVESNTLSRFMDMVKQMQDSGETLTAPVLDITPEGEEPQETPPERRFKSIADDI